MRAGRDSVAGGENRKCYGVGVGEGAAAEAEGSSGSTGNAVASAGTTASTSVLADRILCLRSAACAASTEFGIAAFCSKVSSGTGVGVAAAVFSVESEHPTLSKAPASRVVNAVFFTGRI